MDAFQYNSLHPLIVIVSSVFSSGVLVSLLNIWITKKEKNAAKNRLDAEALASTIQGAAGGVIKELRRECDECKKRISALESLLEKKSLELVHAKNEMLSLRQRISTLEVIGSRGFWFSDIDGKCLWINPVLENILGMSPSDAYGDGWINSLHPDDRERVSSKWRGSAGEGKQFSEKYKLVNMISGKVTVVFGHSYPVRDVGGGEIKGHVGVCEIIS